MAGFELERAPTERKRREAKEIVEHSIHFPTEAQQRMPCLLESGRHLFRTGLHRYLTGFRLCLLSVLL